jgi:hemolysin III
MALLGIAFLASWKTAPLWLYTSIYLTMGWTVCLGYFEMARALSYRALRPLWIGGLLYTVGALLNASGWPRPLPGIFGEHELFHLFVMGGSLCHFWFTLRRVVPFDRRRLTPTQPIRIPAIRPARAGLLQWITSASR